MKNKIEDLRNHLFETIEALKDPDKPMDLERARAVADVSKVIIDSAKVEVDFLRVTGQAKGSGFIPEERQLTPGEEGSRPALAKPPARLRA